MIEAVSNAKRITELGPDWDEQGAQAIAEQTFDRASKFLRSAAVQVASMGLSLPPPRISPCADGSIDLFWKMAAFRLLVNVQPGAQDSDFYGEAAGGVQIKGPFNPETFDAANFRWLLQQ